MESILSKNLRLLYLGQLVTLIGGLGTLGATVLVMLPLLSEAASDPLWMLKLGSFLLMAAYIVSALGTVVFFVGLVRLREDHKGYRAAMLLTLTGFALNVLLRLLGLGGMLVELVKDVPVCASAYMVILATNAFLLERKEERLARWGRIASYLVVGMYPVMTVISQWFTDAIPEMELAPVVYLAVGCLLIALSLVPVAAFANFLRRGGSKLAQPWEMPDAASGPAE